MAGRNLNIVILAAGKGTRMKSQKSKVLQKVCGISMARRVVKTALALDPSRVVVVVGHAMEDVKAELADFSDLVFAVQSELLGTGDAVKRALPHIDESAPTLILYGDVPLVEKETLSAFLSSCPDGLGILSAKVPNPKGYGRIVKDSNGTVQAIVEENDASDSQKLIDEINTGMLLIPAGKARGWLEAIKNDNSKKEYYLTDIVKMAVSEGVPVRAFPVEDHRTVEGANDKEQLANLSQFLLAKSRSQMMRDGLLLMDPASFMLEGELKFGSDVEIGSNVVVRGSCELADGVVIEPNVVLIDSKIGPNAKIRSFSHLEDCEVGAQCEVGPFARLRPKAKLAAKAKIGNFVEIKKSTIGEGSKVNHLTYIGDTEMGSGCNIGAGTITCNYDGVNKHVTKIGNDVFVGSSTILVAPISVGDGAITGAGSVLTKNCPPNELSISRTAQKSIPWRRKDGK